MAVLVTTLIQAGLIDTPNLIMRLLTSSNILLFLLLALFASGSPIDAKKPKPKLAPIDTKLANQHNNLVHHVQPQDNHATTHVQPQDNRATTHVQPQDNHAASPQDGNGIESHSPTPLLMKSPPTTPYPLDYSDESDSEQEKQRKREKRKVSLSPNQED
ncbi:hypothetical protein F5887DRAFT_619827 [Amanita rubescens]|nr:hypothetical protein F5887DRAFT_619827 [Amanita rubescens]